ncbi:iron-containing redox enzyme family protein [Bordetella sp. LUAb4]|uniref:iron-containing redox enzyme family protein n=1 Tax=Bordetella sp. LUAb4 TaxID=2843195 RepID=UPI001E611132|nr:iron-containing redox enzyme family protein [Bordetella sp. LUAb4]
MYQKAVCDVPPKFDFSSPALFTDALLQYADCDLYRDGDTWTHRDQPYERELRPQDFKHFNFEHPIGQSAFFNYQSMAAHRLLLTIYESDFLLLPRSGMHDQYARFLNFYSPDRHALGQLIRPRLERYLFTFLDEEIDVAGDWTEQQLQQYFSRYMEECARAGALPAIDVIRSSANPENALLTLCIQLAGDFLVESSAMSRNAGGRYGQEQSELFKILIDEYGYGVHARKHSTLFENLLTSLGLTRDLHDYWQFYLTSSLALNNYSNYLCANHALYFRYIGSTFQTETMFIQYCRQMADLLRELHPSVDRSYFLEHAHIDQQHSLMAYEKLVKPTVARHGRKVIPEIIRGFEAARLLGRYADSDFAQQVQWMDDGERYKALHAHIYGNLVSAGFPAARRSYTEPIHDLSVTHVHDADELVHVDRGELHLFNGKGSHVALHEGEGMVIRKHRLHGAWVASPECVYTVHTLGDHTEWL